MVQITRRDVVSLASQIFDTQGFVSPYVLSNETNDLFEIRYTTDFYYIQRESKARLEQRTCRSGTVRTELRIQH